MHNKLQELTEKIYNEGVSKGNQEAQKILDEANKKAEEIIANANKQAEGIIESAEKKSREIEKNTLSEVKIAANQAISSLKQEIVQLVNDKVINQPVSEAINQTEFLKDILKTLVDNWSQKNSFDFNVILPTNKQQELEKYLKDSTKKLVDAGVEINYSEEVSSGFQLEAKDGGYKLNFSDQDFQQFFKPFLRPKLVEFLFEKD